MIDELASRRPTLSRERVERLAGRPRLDFAGLVADLRSLGLQRGQDLLVHCSMRQVGRVDGGAATLLAAIQDVAGPSATVVVPTHTAWTSPTSRDFRAMTASLDQDGVERYLAVQPGFDPASTPSAGMGAFAEYVRTRPQARRSAHPQSSFAAIGRRAAACTAGHDPDCHLGERSPLRWLYDAGAAILLLGVDYTVCTAFHLAEYRIARHLPVRGADLDDSDFAQLGNALDAAWLHGPARPGIAPRSGQVGTGASRTVPVRRAVDFAVGWLAGHRNLVTHGK